MIFNDEITNTMSSSETPGHEPPTDTDRTMIRVHELTGEITAIHAQLMQDEWFDHHRFDKAVPVLWDVRKTVLPDDFDYLSRIVGELIQKSVQQRPAGRASIVVSRQSDFDNLCRAYRENIQKGRMLVTMSMTEARQWLGGDVPATPRPCR